MVTVDQALGFCGWCLCRGIKLVDMMKRKKHPSNWLVNHLNFEGHGLNSWFGNQKKKEIKQEASHCLYVCLNSKCDRGLRGGSAWVVMFFRGNCTTCKSNQGIHPLIGNEHIFIVSYMSVISMKTVVQKKVRMRLNITRRGDKLLRFS